MKKKIQSGLLAIALLSFCSSGFAADFKIATVDLRKVFDNYYKTIQASLANSNSIVDRDKELNSMIDTRNKRDTDRHSLNRIRHGRLRASRIASTFSASLVLRIDSQRALHRQLCSVRMRPPAFGLLVGLADSLSG